VTSNIRFNSFKKNFFLQERLFTRIYSSCIVAPKVIILTLRIYKHKLNHNYYKAYQSTDSRVSGSKKRQIWEQKGRQTLFELKTKQPIGSKENRFFSGILGCLYMIFFSNLYCIKESRLWAWNPYNAQIAPATAIRSNTNKCKRFSYPKIHVTSMSHF